jgi:hypothetical protein
VRRAGACAIFTRQDQVTIGLRPVDTVQDQLTYFHIASSTKGFLPVHVVIHNRSTTDSLLFEKSAISYTSGNNGPAENTAEQKAGISVASAVPFVGAFVAMGIAETESQVKQNLMLQELQSDTLAPGETIHGLLHIAIPKRGPRPKLHIQFPIARSARAKPPL